MPTVGQDATAQGMAWILEGYQCGSVYKAIYKEAQDAVAMANVLLSGQSRPRLCRTARPSTRPTRASPSRRPC